MKRALVIGGTGPTGPGVVEGLLDRGYEVAILHRGVHEVDLPPEVEHIHVDPHFTETLAAGLEGRSFDLVIALYGRVRHIAKVIEGKTPRLITVGGTNAYAAWHTFRSSPAWPSVPVSADAPLQTDLELHKFSALMVATEREVLEAHSRGVYESVVLRYPRVYGPRQLAPKEWSIIRRIRDGRRQLLLPDNGLALTTRGYVDNCVAAMLFVVDRPGVTAGKVYNVADERALSLREWVTAIAVAMNSELEYVDVPYQVAGPTRAYAWHEHHRVLDNRPLIALGYRDVVAPEEGLARSVDWYLEHLPEPGGEIEQQLGDPFDYEAEDAIIAALKRSLGEIAAISYRDVVNRHPYAHPKTPHQTS